MVNIRSVMGYKPCTVYYCFTKAIACKLQTYQKSVRAMRRLNVENHMDSICQKLFQMKSECFSSKQGITILKSENISLKALEHFCFCICTM